MKKIISNRFRELLAIKARHDKRTISQREVAEITGLSRVTIDNYARNQVTRFDAHVLLTLCDYLGCTLNDFLIVEEDPEIKTPLVA